MYHNLGNFHVKNIHAAILKILPIMLTLCLMLSGAYYVKTYNLGLSIMLKFLPIMILINFRGSRVSMKVF